MSIIKVFEGWFSNTEHDQSGTVSSGNQPTLQQIPRRAEVDKHLTVQAVHDTFNTESTRLLEEARSLIANANKKVEKIKPIVEQKRDLASRLRSLGFTSAKQVEEHRKIAQELEASQKTQQEKKDEAELIMYYSMHYMQKFITLKSVMELCSKYGLLCGPVDRFISEVPEKNLREIENFKSKVIKPEDKVYHFPHLGRGRVKEASYKEYLADQAYHKAQRSSRYNDDASASNDLESYLDADKLWQRSRINYFGALGGYPTQVEPLEVFEICALPKDFNQEGMEVKGHKLVLKEDPIVLFKVRGGYLIVTAWGAEASDPLVVNPKTN